MLTWGQMEVVFFFFCHIDFRNSAYYVSLFDVIHINLLTVLTGLVLTQPL